jgi:hypothetical protein
MTHAGSGLSSAAPSVTPSSVTGWPADFGPRPRSISTDGTAVTWWSSGRCQPPAVRPVLSFGATSAALLTGWCRREPAAPGPRGSGAGSDLGLPTTDLAADAPVVPLLPVLLGLRRAGAAHPWCAEGQRACSASARAMPPVDPGRRRSCSAACRAEQRCSVFPVFPPLTGV